MANSAPLLVNHEETNEIGRAHTQTHAFLNLLKGINLVTSALALALAVATHIIVKRVPTGSQVWEVWGTTEVLAVWMFISLIFSAINVAANIHNLINIVVDIFLAVKITPAVVNLIFSFPNDHWCTRYRYPPYPNPPEKLPVDPKCEDWKVIIVYLMLATSLFAIAVGIIYFIFLILRAIAIIKSKFWRNMVGPGEFSITLSFKVTRPEGVTSQHDDDEAGPSSGRGAVYI